MKALIIALLLALPCICFAQVEHNFEMGPENTDCAVLDTLTSSEPDLAKRILASTFRVKEELEISRYSAPRKFVYASCDGSTGFLLVYTDSTSIEVYKNIDVTTWSGIRNATDPREEYREIKPVLERVQKKAP